MEKILFTGMPGSGKGTQAKLLAKFKFKHISTGDLMRDAWEKNDPLITPYKESVNKGNFLPDKIVFELVERGVKNLKEFKGYVLDGAVRNVNQAKIALKKKLFGTTIHFSLTEDIATKRLVKRSKSSKIKRSDDNPQTIKKRFQVYLAKTDPVIKYLKQNTEFHSIDASPTVKEIHNAVVAVLDLK